jgi:transglutaminase-like putative cysteine protease
MVRFRVEHRTEYHYSHAMADGFTIVHLAPRPTRWQQVESVDLRVDPQPDEMDFAIDQFGNAVTRFAVHRPHQALIVDGTSVVDVSTPPAAISDTPWEAVVQQAARATGWLAGEVGPFLAHTAQTPRLPGVAELTSLEFSPGRPIVEALSGLCGRIFEEFRFDAGFSDVTTPLATVLAERRGVCQDFAHVSAAALRSIGIPARYVSGYVETVPAPGEQRLVGVDASHAWCSAWAGSLGWLDFDPTNNQMPPLRHPTVGWGRDYDDVAPVRGVVIGSSGRQSLTVSVDVASLG